MTAKEYARIMREECYRQNKDIMEVTAELWLEIADNIENLANQAVEDYKNEIIKELKEAKFPIIDLKMGVKINGIQHTDDTVLYKRALEILKSAANATNGGI